MLISRDQKFLEAVAGGAERSEAKTATAGHRDTEVPAKAVRRKFSAEYKRRIVEEAERLRDTGEIGTLLRREGLYSSQLAAWRRQYEEGALRGLRDDKRGRKRKPANPLSGRVSELERENRRLRRKLKQAEVIIDVQKKVAAILAEEADPKEDES